MPGPLKIAIGVTATVLLGLAVWGCCGLTRHIIVAVDRFGDAGAGLAQTAAKLNGKHGTIAMLDEDAGASKSLIIHADLVARHEQQSLNTWDRRTTELFNNVNGGVTDLRGTVKAATGTANAATGLLSESTDTVRTLNDPRTGLPATLGNANGAVTDLRKLTPELKRTATASANTMEHVNGITGDGQKVADHYEQIIDNPKKYPWYIRMLPSMARVAVEAALDKWAMSK